MSFTHSQHATALVAATPEALFAFLDNARNLGGHMEKPSAMMLGGSMRYTFDAGGGQALGSIIIMQGSVLGLGLALEEIVTEHAPPLRKAWETRGNPRLLVIGPYRMGFAITPEGAASQLTVFIDFDLPQHGLGRFLGALFGRAYARWCVDRMASDARRHFERALG